MVHSPAFTFSSGYPLGFLPCAGLRLGVLRWFQAFLASSPCAASATSYHFSSIASPPWRSVFSRFALVVKLGFPVLASGSNCAVKPTRLRRAAYFRSLSIHSSTSLLKYRNEKILPLLRLGVWRIGFSRRFCANSDGAEWLLCQWSSSNGTRWLICWWQPSNGPRRFVCWW